MKNLFFTVVALFATSSIFAQQGLEITLGFTPGSSLYLNDEDFAAGEDLNFQATYAFNTGLTVGYNFTDKIGIATGIGFAQLNQNYITDRDGVSKSDQNRWTRSQSYLRIPVLLRVGGDNMNGSSAFFRIGPHFDFLTAATSLNKGSENNPSENTTNLRDQSILGTKINLVEDMVIGLSADVGARIRINDYMGILLMLHLEGNLLNMEAEDAHLYFSHTGSILLGTSERSETRAIMGGITVGFQYVLDFN
jgi:hypothetical protein